MRRNSESGNALLMVTVVSMALTSAILVLLRKAETRAKGIQITQMKSSRDQVFRNLKGIITAPAAIKASTQTTTLLAGLPDGNIELSRCLDVSGREDCISTGQDTFVGFELYDEHQNRFSSSWPENLRLIQRNAGEKFPEALLRFSGIPFPTPQFDKRANRCAAGTLCPLATYTAFRAWCPQPVNAQQGLTLIRFNPDGSRNILSGRPAKCDQAEFIQFFIAVGGSTYATGPVPREQRVLPFATRHNFFTGSPSQLGSRTREIDEVLMTVDEINNNGVRLCPTGMSTVGIDSNGYPRCEFAVNPCVISGDAATGKIIASTENGQLVCRKPFQGESCAELEVFYGVKSDGSLDCRRPKFEAGCAADQIAVSFDAKGNPNCVRAQTGQACPSPAVLVGFDADGIAVCKLAETLFSGISINPTWE
ncbi:MAG: hypothetical protein RL189_1619 [Pseudomonadota bacterium]|jgi:hypothetical protein